MEYALAGIWLAGIYPASIIHEKYLKDIKEAVADAYVSKIFFSLFWPIAIPFLILLAIVIAVPSIIIQKFFIKD
jgi:hypothetical protein